MLITTIMPLLSASKIPLPPIKRLVNKFFASVIDRNIKVKLITSSKTMTAKGAWKDLSRSLEAVA